MNRIKAKGIFALNRSMIAASSVPKFDRLVYTLKQIHEFGLYLTVQPLRFSYTLRFAL